MKNKKYQDLTGQRFGRLIVVKEAGYKIIGKKIKKKKLQWLCKCDCGNEHTVVGEALKSGVVRSCGCLYKETRHTAPKTYCTYDLESYEFGIGYCNNGTHFFFDKEDYEKINQYAWWYDGRYVCAHSLYNDEYTTKIIRLHRVVLDIPDREDIEVDHKNLVRYDCRKINLRTATTSENARNKDVSYLSPTGITGVRKENNKWLASIKYNKENIRIGLFDTIEEAASARLEAELKYFGEFHCCPEQYDIIDEQLILLQ